MITYPTDSRVTHEQAIVRALSSITSKQVDIIAGLARASGQDWGVQAVDDYDGYRSIYIDANTGGKEQRAFFIAGTAQRLDLFAMHDDDLSLIGTFTDMEALGARLTGMVGRQ